MHYRTERRIFRNDMITAEYVKSVLNEARGGVAGERATALAREYCGFSPEDGEAAFERAMSALRYDLRYDPDPFISTLNYTPADALASRIAPLWTNEITLRLAALAVPQADAENFFRWHRMRAYDMIINAAGADIPIPPAGEEGTLDFLCPFAYSSLYMGGLVDAGSGILLRRVNCRPWGIKPIGDRPLP